MHLESPTSKNPYSENQNLKTHSLQKPLENHPGNHLENQWTVYRTRFLVRAQQLTAPLVFTDALGREQSGVPGDYLVESSAGVKRITTKALFEDIYVPLLNSNNGTPGTHARPVSRATPQERTRATA